VRGGFRLLSASDIRALSGGAAGDCRDATLVNNIVNFGYGIVALTPGSD